MTSTAAHHVIAGHRWGLARAGAGVASLALALGGFASGAASAAAPPCTQFVSTSAAGTALGVAVRAETPSVVGLNGNAMGVLCGYYPVHPTRKLPSSEPAGTLVVADGTGSSASLHQLIAFDTNPKTDPGFKRTSLHGIGTTAVLGVQKQTGLVIVWVLAGHTVYYVWSQELRKGAVERFARAVAHTV